MWLRCASISIRSQVPSLLDLKPRAYKNYDALILKWNIVKWEGKIILFHRESLLFDEAWSSSSHFLWEFEYLKNTPGLFSTFLSYFGTRNFETLTLQISHSFGEDKFPTKIRLRVNRMKNSFRDTCKILLSRARKILYFQEKQDRKFVEPILRRVKVNHRYVRPTSLQRRKKRVDSLDIISSLSPPRTI